jgi:Na+/H+ antiporter
MLHDNILLILGLLFVMALLYMLSQKLRVSYPIFLVLGGLLIGFVPGMPRIALDPQIAFLIFLPPLLYEAAWFTSWYDFWKWKRPIALLAFGLVFLTSLAVAVFSTALIPGFTLALGFLLGGIISPPDAVAAQSVLKGLKIPKRLTTILEGESLVNDASSLIVFRFALAAVLTGQFVWQTAILNFFVVSVMGIVVGIAVALLFYAIHKYLPTTPSVDTILTLMTPYIMYLAAEQFHFSGVLAVVSGGLFLSFRSHAIFDYKTRIQTMGVWSSLIFLLNGLVFILIGLQLPVIVDGLGDFSVGEAIYYAILISILTIVIRILWVYPNTYLPRVLSKKIREREPFPSPKLVFLVGWAGMRGVVSLASALAVPLTLADGATAFPQRNLILFITFIVILITLVFQGLTMPLLIRVLKIEDDAQIPEHRQLSEIRCRMANHSINYLDENHSAEVESNAKLKRFYEQLHHTIKREQQNATEDGDAKERAEAREQFNRIFLELVANRRKELLNIRRERIYDDEVLREYEHTLDLEEARMQV